MAGYKVLLVEDDQIWTDILQRRIRLALRDIGCIKDSITVATHFDEAYNLLREYYWSLLVTDIGLGDPHESVKKKGKHLLQLAHNQKIAAIAVSGTSGLTRRDVRDFYEEYSVVSFFDKMDFDEEQFVIKVKEILLASREGETLAFFFEKVGAEIEFYNRQSLRIISISGLLNAYVALPVLLIDAQPTEHDVTRLVELAQQQVLNRTNYAGILLYRDPPDTLFRIKMAEVRIRNHFVLIPIPLAAVELALPENAACVGLISEYAHRYLSSADLFDDRNAIGDTLSFFGRAKLLNRLEEELVRNQGVGLFGLRKSGKTSMLLQISFALRQYPVVHIDLQPFGSQRRYGAEIFNQFLQQLLKLTGGQTVVQANHLYFEHHVSAVNLTTEFIKRVGEIAQTLQKIGYKLPIICLLDEVERILPSPTDPPEKVEEFNSLFGTLRTLSQERRELGILVVDVHPDCNRINQWSQPNVPTNPVFNFFKEEFISPFSTIDTETMLNDIGQLMGRSFDRETLVSIHYKSGGHPFISRQLASLLCRRVPVEENKQINISMSQKYLKKPFTYSGVLKDYFGQSVWDDLQKRGFKSAMNILYLLTCNEVQEDESIYKEFEKDLFTNGLTEQILLEELNNDFTTSESLDALIWLEAVGFIAREELDDDNYYRIRVPLLSQWLRMQMRNEEINQWKIT